MVNDPIGDMLIQIKNASLAGCKSIDIPYSRTKFSVAEILASEKYIEKAQKSGEDPKLVLRILLRYESGKPAISGVKMVSKPGLRWYVNQREIPKVVGGMGTAIISTSQGVMTGREAVRRGIGGEIMCEVW